MCTLIIRFILKFQRDAVPNMYPILYYIIVDLCMASTYKVKQRVISSSMSWYLNRCMELLEAKMYLGCTSFALNLFTWNLCFYAIWISFRHRITNWNDELLCVLWILEPFANFPSDRFSFFKQYTILMRCGIILSCYRMRKNKIKHNFIHTITLKI